MIRLQLVCAIGAATLVASCAPVERPKHGALATASLIGRDGAVLGQARLTAAGARVEIGLDVRGFQPGVHGAHLHMVGKCEPSEFASAGGHLNPSGRKHGAANPDGSHLGDLPNLTVAPDGKGGMSATLSGDPAATQAALFDADGTSIVIHAAPDDYRTDPSGNSGARIACGVFLPLR